MADAPQNFTDMFKNLGEQLKLPPFDMTKIMEHHQKNLDAMTQVVAGDGGRRQRDRPEAARDLRGRR